MWHGQAMTLSLEQFSNHYPTLQINDPESNLYTVNSGNYNLVRNIIMCFSVSNHMRISDCSFTCICTCRSGTEREQRLPGGSHFQSLAAVWHRASITGLITGPVTC